MHQRRPTPRSSGASTAGHQAAGIAAESIDHRFGAAVYRDRSGCGRNLTSVVLEFFDRAGVTRFEAGRRRMAEAAAVVP